jgi:hypothetical protein
MIKNPLEFGFTIGENLSTKEIEELYQNTHLIQKKFNAFLETQISEDDFCDCLREFDIWLPILTIL